ncbi:MAG: cytochrome c oxidase subunit [Ilumatobacteraceae bacterium]|nr:cytochrome c oxidase subunit [Ilumatobacteraceae bacterium]
MKTVRRSLRRPALALGGIAAAVVLAGCAKNAPQDTFRPAGENARKIDNLQRPVFYTAGIVLLIVIAAVVFAMIKYRDRGQEMPEQTHGKPWLEILLTIIPAVILLFVGVFTVKTVFALAKVDDTQCIVNVTGQQWWWEYDYPAQAGCMPGGITTPIVTSGELVIPDQTKVLLHITSRDVIHSFWIPRLNGKRDAVPGRDQTLRMEADQPGIYTGQCTEFCGLSHARMRMAAVSLNADDFGTWVANQTKAYAPAEKDTLAAQGETQFITNCSRCHQVNGLTTTDANGVVTPVLANPDQYEVSGSAPNLTDLMTRTTFAGATFDLLTPACRERLYNAPPDQFGKLYLQGVTPECFNEGELRDWLRNAPAKKPMYSAENEKLDGKYRGMPNLNLTENQIDQLVAYLLERK